MYPRVQRWKTGGWGVDATRQRQNLLRTGYAKALGASGDPDAIPLFRDFVAQKGAFKSSGIGG